MPYCVSCGHQVVSDATFCDECGAEAFRPPAGAQQPSTAHGSLVVRPYYGSPANLERSGRAATDDLLTCQAVVVSGVLTALDDFAKAIKSGQAIFADFKREGEEVTAHFPVLGAGTYTALIFRFHNDSSYGDVYWGNKKTVSVFAGSRVECALPFLNRIKGDGTFVILR